MGGNALKIRTQRLPADEYHRLASEITEQIQQISGARADPLRAYRNKADFGDLDILVAREGALPGRATGRNCYTDKTNTTKEEK